MHATPVTDVPGRPTASCGQDFERAGYRYFLSLQSADQTTLSEDSADRRMLAQLFKKEIPATVSRLLTALGTNDLSQLTGPRVLSAMLPLPFISNILVRVNNTLAEGEHCTAEEMIIWLELFAAMIAVELTAQWAGEQYSFIPSSVQTCSRARAPESLTCILANRPVLSSTRARVARRQANVSAAAGECGTRIPTHADRNARAADQPCLGTISLTRPNYSNSGSGRADACQRALRKCERCWSFVGCVGGHTRGSVGGSIGGRASWWEHRWGELAGGIIGERIAGHICTWLGSLQYWWGR